MKLFEPRRYIFWLHTIAAATAAASLSSCGTPRATIDVSPKEQKVFDAQLGVALALLVVFKQCLLKNGYTEKTLARGGFDAGFSLEISYDADHGTPELQAFALDPRKPKPLGRREKACLRATRQLAPKVLEDLAGKNREALERLKGSSVKGEGRLFPVTHFELRSKDHPESPPVRVDVKL